MGLNMANASLKDGDSTAVEDNKILFAPRIGFTFETPVHENIFIQTGIFVTASGYSFDSKRYIDGEDFTVEEVDSKEKFVLLYLELPVHAGYKYELSDNASVFGMLGPVFRFMPYSTLAFKIDGEWDNEVTHFGEGDDKIEMFNKFDMGLNIEAGIQVDRVQFSLFYNPCFINIFNDELMGPDAKWKNYNFGINFAVLFGNVEQGGSRGYGRR